MARRPRKLPWSSGRGLFAHLVRLVPGSAPNSRPTVDWKQIEQAYGETLSADVRESLVTATQIFILLEDSERAAEPLAHAHKAIDDIEADANRLQATLIRAMRSDAGILAIDLIERNFESSPLSGSFFPTLTTLLASVPDGCAAARQELSESPVKKEGDAWSEWIVRVTKIIRDSGLPWQASKDWRGKKSPFVALIEVLQKHLPKESTRHTHSEGALAKAIVSARSRDE